MVEKGLIAPFLLTNINVNIDKYQREKLAQSVIMCYLYIIKQYKNTKP